MSKTKDGTSENRLVARRRGTAARKQSPVKPRAVARKKLRERIHTRWASEAGGCTCEADPMAPPKNSTNIGDWVRYWSTDERLRRLECFAENLSKWLQADAKCAPEGFATWAQEVNDHIGGGGGDAPSKPPVYPPS